MAPRGFVAAARNRLLAAAGTVALALALGLLVAACGGGEGGALEPDPVAAGRPPEPPAAGPPEPPSPPEPRPPADPPGSPGTVAPGPAGPGPADPPPGPPEPFTPRRLLDENCAVIADEAAAVIQEAPQRDPEAHAYRALARLCLGADAGPDLAVALQSGELSPETRELLTAVEAAGLPKGDALRDVVRETAEP